LQFSVTLSAQTGEEEIGEPIQMIQVRLVADATKRRKKKERKRK
jgi:hypothetical protein